MNEYDLFRNYQISVKIFNNFLFSVERFVFSEIYYIVQIEENSVYKKGFEWKADECETRERY